jgi:hypothetical protein
MADPTAVKRRAKPPDFTSKSMSRDVRLGMLVSLNFGGTRWPDSAPLPQGVSQNAVDFWLGIKRRFPTKYVEGICKLIRHDDESDASGIQIVVQQLVIGNGGPVPGVLASPIRAHIAGPRLVVDNEVDDE